MKAYEVPTMNISKFAMENVVTLSSVGKAAEALAAAGVEERNVVKTKVSDWTPIN